MPPLCTRQLQIGFASAALSFVTVFGDFSEGLALAKMSLSLLEIHNNVLLPDVYALVYGTVMIWKNPMQSVLPHLLDGYRVAQKSGYIGTTGHACAMFYAYRAFFTGSQLSSLGKEVALFMRKSERDKRKVMTMSFLPISKGISYIGGSTSQHTNDFIEEEDLDHFFNNHEIAVCECFLVVKLCCDVVFRRFDALKSIARNYIEYNERVAVVLPSLSTSTAFSTVVWFRCISIERIMTSFGWIELHTPSRSWKHGRQRVLGILRISCICCRQRVTMLLVKWRVRQQNTERPLNRLISTVLFTRKPWRVSKQLPFTRSAAMKTWQMNS